MVNSVSFVSNQYPYHDTYCYFRQNDVNVSRVMKAVIERYTVQLSGFSTPITLETFPCLWSSKYEITVIICDHDVDYVQGVYCSPVLPVIVVDGYCHFMLSGSKNCIIILLQFSNILLYVVFQV